MEISKYKAKTWREACVWLQGRAGALTTPGVKEKAFRCSAVLEEDI